VNRNDFGNISVSYGVKVVQVDTVSSSWTGFIINNMSSYIGFQLTQKSMTSIDLEWPKRNSRLASVLLIYVLCLLHQIKIFSERLLTIFDIFDINALFPW